MASAATRLTLCAAGVGLRPTIFRSLPAGNVDILLNARESITGVLRPKGVILLGLDV